jgi:drug/metabolite transporter (DMT)-like permease
VALASAGIHDICAACLITLYNWRCGRLRELGRSLASRPGKSVLVGSILGAMLGMGGYMTGLQLAGPAYTLPITTLYPAVAAICALFVLKENIPPRGWIGLILCVSGAVLVGYVPPAGLTGAYFYWGIAFAGIAALGWGTEGVCITSAMDFVEPEIALNMYYLTSVLFYLGLAVPCASMFLEIELTDVSGLFLRSGGTKILALAGAVCLCSYLCWYKSMNMIGVSRAMSLNIGYALWGILFSALFAEVELTGTLIVGSMIIFAGMCLVIGNPRKILSLRRVE